MRDWFVWWLVIEAMALVALPLCLVAFSRLPDRGYTLSKAFALLLVGYAFWLLNSIGALPNDRGGIIAAMLLVALIASWAAWARREELIEWWRRNWGYALAIEIAFFYLFAMAVWLRSLVGQISGTEQPMDLMFLNAATRAESFPPIDPWLSGETVAYYYFGYLIVAMIGQVAGVPTMIGYNIGFGMIAALTLVGGFGIVYNLVKLHEDASEAEVEEQPAVEARVAVPAGGAGAPEGADAPQRLFGELSWKPYIFGVAAALMLVVTGNITWLFKYMAGLGIGGDWLYDWIDVDGITADQPMETWYPSEYFGFFGATRIFRINNEEPPFRVITEFPMFSFLLGDLHPHVMALPFVLVVVALALALFLSREPLDIAFWLRRPLALAGAAVLLGALAFINTWDIVTLAFVLALVALVHNWLLRPHEGFRGEVRASFDARDAQLVGIVAVLNVGAAILILAIMQPGLLLTVALIGAMLVWCAVFAAYLLKGNAWAHLAETAVRTLSFVLPLVLLAVAAYLPFYDSFSSQAGGVLPVVTRPPGLTVPGTRPVHALIFWLPLFTVFVPFVLLRIFAQRERVTQRSLLAAAAVPVLVVVAWAVVFIVAVEIIDTAKLTGASGFFDQIIDRGVGWITAAFFGALLAAALLALWLEATRDDRSVERAPLFALVLGTTALLLILGTEFFYIDDVFHVRMNTVFKLYYQAWLLLAMAGGFALYQLASTWRFELRRERAYRYAWAGALAAVLAAAALYPIGATMNRVRPYNSEGGRIEELRGLDGLARFPADERAAIAWLTELGEGQHIVIAEAVGNDYTLAGRISGSTGVPTVLGWGGHEDQWRGDSSARAGRFEDIQALYQGDMSTVEQIVNKYGITYIYVGELERNTYGEASLAKFQELPVAFQEGNVTVYRAAAAQAAVEGAQ